MTKRDWIWVAIRIFGIYLLVDAITAIPTLISSVGLMLQYVNVASSGAADPDHYLRLLRNNMIQNFASSLGRLIICGGFGMYFIKGAALLFKLICPPDSDSKDERSV